MLEISGYCISAKMKRHNLNIVIWFLALIVASLAQDYVCNNASSSPAGAPSMPIISNSYQAHVEVNMLDKNYSMALDEYLDYDGNRAVLVIYKGGHTESMIFSYDTNEVFDIINQSCKVYSVDNNTYTFLLGPFPNNVSDTDKRHIFGTAASLRFTPDRQPIYNGTGSVRGIPADIWTACFSWPNASGKAIYYFSQPGWNTSSPEQQIPLRVEVEGLVSGVKGSGGIGLAQSRHIHHIYDLIGYLPFVNADPSIFQTPPQVICPKRKSEKKLPTFAPNFKYKAEIVDSIDSFITQYAIWYDENYKMVREDTRKQETSSGSGLLVLNTTTEIHDFNTGVRYIMDPVAGCTLKPIDPSEADTDQDVARFQLNGSLVVDIRDPNSFFVLNYNYTYTGQRITRGINCDIFSTIIPDYTLQGTKVNAIFEYAFLAEGWSEIPLYASETNVQNYPVQLVISAPSMPYTRVYNYFEFAEEPVTYPTYDVSSCFSEKQKLGFQITFPGDFGVGLETQWTAQIYNTLVKTMQVFPIRVGGITITFDDDNIYANAYVLAASSSAQFEKNPKPSLERLNDKFIKGVAMSDECASLCVDNADFICMGFQYCPDDGHACTLGKKREPSNSVPNNGTACDEFARTVKIASKREPLLKDAFGSLVTAVSQGDFQIIITDNTGTVLAPFTALSVQLVSGQVSLNKPLPTLPSAFSYKMESIIASSSIVQETYIWYDQSLGLVRYDTRNPTSGTPNMMTQIHDFNIGVSYQINQVMEECSVTPISSSGVFDVSTATVSSIRNGGLVVIMKTPNSLFFLDDTYTYVGQSTTRGILCDVFESKRGDFDLEYYNSSSQDTVFKYYFQASSWTYITPVSTTATQSQPIQLNVEDKFTGEYLTYNFYDFTEQHFPASFYDTSVCYTPDEKKTFLITFKNQPYHPVLDEMSNVFIETALDKLAQLTYTSPINFQHISLVFDDSSVYFIVTALGQTALINQFSQVMKVAHNTSISQINALSLGDCAAACVLASGYICNSFDYCVDTSIPNCLLGATHAETEGDPLEANGPCTHFSRTENGTYPAMSVDKMYSTIANNVYQDKFQIAITLRNGTKVAYLATDITDDVLSPNNPDSDAGKDLQKFYINPGFELTPNMIVITHNSVSLTDCVGYCIKDETFVCQAFDYQFTQNTCRLSNIHPDELNITNPGVTKNVLSSVYSRFYTAEYIKYDGQVFGTHPDKTIPNIKSDELCARACTDNTNFTCEAFEICTDGSCLLRKTHILEAHSSDLTQNYSCVHYSRNHLFDYVHQDNKIIDGYDDASLLVKDAPQCAQLCGSGEGLPLCASFEVCQQQEGVTVCTLSTADPTVQTGFSIIDSQKCTLYTKANSGTNNAAGQCSAQSSSSGESSDTGARIGIAFGTLILGLLVGAGIMFIFLRFRHGRNGDQDVTVLKTWDT